MTESNRLIDLVYLRALNDRHVSEATDAIEAQAKRIEELEDGYREIYEVYAGSEGFIPETCAEAYQQQLIKEMSDIAAKHMRKGKNNG